jgi:hypothetical protein
MTRLNWVENSLILCVQVPNVTDSRTWWSPVTVPLGQPTPCKSALTWRSNLNTIFLLARAVHFSIPLQIYSYTEPEQYLARKINTPCNPSSCVCVREGRSHYDTHYLSQWQIWPTSRKFMPENASVNNTGFVDGKGMQKFFSALQMDFWLCIYLFICF